MTGRRTVRRRSAAQVVAAPLAGVLAAAGALAGLAVGAGAAVTGTSARTVAAAAPAVTAHAGSSVAHARRAATGGTAYFAEQPESPPNYIFPLVSGAYFSGTNTQDFQTLLYQPLYWYGDQGRTSIDYRLSLGDAPVYSDGDRVVTITLKDEKWSDGEPVSARDVVFWIDLLKADTADWASYVPGGFPDNVVSAKAISSRTVQLHLNASYNPEWYTYNELSQITPLPIAWDRTSLAAKAPSSGAPGLPDTTTAGAKAVFRFLNAQATDLTTYASSPIWSVVDGAWRLTSLTTEGTATFVPNPDYGGPDRPRLAKLVELPFTSAESEFSLLASGPSSGGSSAPQVSVGYVPDTDLPRASALKEKGYQLVEAYPFQFDYLEPNFDNPTVGPIFRQLYFRQAFQHLIDQSGWIHAYYGGLGIPTYGPIPAEPANPYADGVESKNPYPFSVSDARLLLGAHGWKVVAGGTTTCIRPGMGSDACGKGVRKGQALDFTLLYPSGLSYTDGAMVDLQSVAKEVGIVITLKEVTTTTIDSTVLSCSSSQPACDWQLGQYGFGWVFEPDHYPSGEEIFQTGALGNVSNYSDPAIDRLILATTTAPAKDAQKALDAYQDAVRLQLPDFWQPSPGTLVSVQSNLRGVVPNAYGFISPEEWYFASK